MSRGTALMWVALSKKRSRLSNGCAGGTAVNGRGSSLLWVVNIGGDEVDEVDEIGTATYTGGCGKGAVNGLDVKRNVSVLGTEEDGRNIM